MTCSICAACGTQFSESPEPPKACPVYEDERQFVPQAGQRWTDMTSLGRDHEVIWKEEAEGIHSLQISLAFAIGHRAFFIEGPGGNILWDCLSLVDQASVRRIAAAGGLAAIAISHPHFNSSMVEWSRSCGGVPIYLHADDSDWIERPDTAANPWKGEALPLGQAVIIRCGGHFAGSSVLHCPWLDDGRGALFLGDTMQVVPDLKHVSFMRSFPNLVPLNVDAVRRIGAAVRPYRFETLYGAFEGRTVRANGQRVVERSVEPYVRAISG